MPETHVAVFISFIKMSVLLPLIVNGDVGILLVCVDSAADGRYPRAESIQWANIHATALYTFSTQAGLG